jgi:chromosome segregation ATPase
VESLKKLTEAIRGEALVTAEELAKTQDILNSVQSELSSKSAELQQVSQRNASLEEKLEKFDSAVNEKVAVQREKFNEELTGMQKQKEELEHNFDKVDSRLKEKIKQLKQQHSGNTSLLPFLIIVDALEKQRIEMQTHSIALQQELEKIKNERLEGMNFCY